MGKYGSVTGKYGTYTIRADGRLEKKVKTNEIDPSSGRAALKPLYATSASEMDELIFNHELAMRNGVDISAANDPFKKWADRWYAIKAPKVSESQQINLNCHLTHINNFIGLMPINKIKPFNIDNMIMQLAKSNPTTGKPMAKKTLRDIRNTAANVFDMAIDNDAIYKNPARGREIPENAPVEQRRDLTEEEQGWIIKTPHRARIGALVMMFAGLRKGELVPLTWGDVDLDNLSINVNKSVEASGSRYLLKDGAKTEAGVRTINITLDLAQELENAKKVSNSIYVCPAASGGMHTPTTWRVMWNSYISVLNFENGSFKDKPKNRLGKNNAKIVIEKITPHMLRHTYATLLYMAGVDVLTAARLMGHADVKTTLAIYTHLKERMVEKSVDKLDDHVRDIFFKFSSKMP